MLVNKLCAACFLMRRYTLLPVSDFFRGIFVGKILEKMVGEYQREKELKELTC